MAAPGCPCLLARRLACRRWPATHTTAWRRLSAVAAAANAATADVVVVGGGAAGLTAAIFAGTRTGGTARVIVLERNAVCGRKILVSGGGRCNVLPSAAVDANADFWPAGDRPASVAAMLRDWTLAECRHWLETDVGVALTEEAGTLKLFPVTNAATTVRDALEAAARRAGATIVPNARVMGVEKGEDGRWLVRQETGAVVSAGAVVLAAGGLSAPRLGTTGDGLDIAQSLGHTLDTTHPALTPLLGGAPGGHALAGVSLSTAVLTIHPRAGRGKPRPTSPRGGLLFTHRGYSGPAALDASAWIAAAAATGVDKEEWPFLTVNWTGAPSSSWQAVFAEAKRPDGGGKSPLLATVLKRGGIPARLAVALVADAGVSADTRAADARAKDVSALVTAATAYRMPVTGSAGFVPAEVTAGGVRLAEVALPSCESRLAPRVYVCGELLAPCGRLGGFNFYWAWVSGRAAGRAAGEAVTQ